MLGQIVSAIKNGDLVCLPTDTLYALSCDATNDDAVQKIFKVKKREFSKALPIFIYNLEQAMQYCHFNKRAQEIVQIFWPGPLTLILPLKENTNLSKHIYSNNNTIALRVPNHKQLLNILDEVKLPLVATSANLSKSPNISKLSKIKEEFGSLVSAYLENQEVIKMDEPSTIVDCSAEKFIILREGKIKTAKLEEFL